MPNWPTTNNVNSLFNRVSELAYRIPLGKVRYSLLVLTGAWFLSLMADIVWMLVPVPVNGQGDMQPVMLPSSMGLKSSSVDVMAMQAWNLFGLTSTPAPEESKVEDSAVDATLTSLELVLLGVLMSDEPEESFAIIQSPSVSGLYKVGDTIPVGNGVMLSKVLVDRVIISNKGNMEFLLLYAESGQKVSTVPSDDQAVQGRIMDQRNNPAISSMANSYRNQLFTNPASLTDVIKVSIAKDADGKTIGYRVRPGRDRDQFTQFGLQAGDVVTSINGTPLDDPAKAMQLYGQLREAQEASFVVKRGNEEINLIVGLKQ